MFCSFNNKIDVLLIYFNISLIHLTYIYLFSLLFIYFLVEIIVKSNICGSAFQPQKI